MRRFLPTDELSPLDMPLSPGLQALGLHAPKLLVRGPTMAVPGGPRTRKKPAAPAPSGITLVGSTGAPSTGLTPGTHAIGDFFFAVGFRVTSDAAISTPAGWTARGGNTANNTVRVHAFSKFAASTSEGVSGFTNAEYLFLWKLRGVHTTSPIGATGAKQASTAPYQTGGLSMTSTTSWWLYAIAVRTVGGTTTLDTSSFQGTHPILGANTNFRRSGAEFASAAAGMQVGDSNGPWGAGGSMATFSSNEGGTTTGRWREASWEIKAA